MSPADSVEGHQGAKNPTATEDYMEKTLLLIKPDAVQRGLIGTIIAKFEHKGFVIEALKLLWMTRGQAETLYAPHKGKGFYEPTVAYMTSSPIAAMVINGEKVIEQVRKLMGATNPQDAQPGTIRGDFGQRIDMNCVHGSDSAESAGREIPIFFSKEELVDYHLDLAKWL
jgi:nucleoside-diphosphate kinase